MRLAGVFIAYYILLLAAVPCCTIDKCPGEKTGSSSRHEQRDEDCGNCSPFFNCEGCASASVVYDPFRFELNSLQVKPVYSLYQHPVLLQTALDVWQPPKLG